MALPLPQSILPGPPIGQSVFAETNGQDVISTTFLDTIPKPKLGFADDMNSRLGFPGEGLLPCEAAISDNIAEKSCVKEESHLEGLCNGEAKGDADEIALKLKAERIVHWPDDYGQDIAQVQEFEPSDSGGSDEDDDSGQACNCVIL